MKTYYTLFDISKNASLEEIKSAYRRLASRYHPDVNRSSEAHDIFKLINRAYDTLIDSDKKRDYDELIAGGKIFRAKDDDQVIETSSLLPALSNTLANILSYAFFAVLMTAFSQWVASIQKIFWSLDTLLAILIGALFGLTIGFNSNFEGKEIFGKNFRVYRIIFWLVILGGLISIFYINYSILKSLVKPWNLPRFQL